MTDIPAGVVERASTRAQLSRSSTPGCNVFRPFDAEVNRSSNVDFVDGQRGSKACVPPRVTPGRRREHTNTGVSRRRLALFRRAHGKVSLKTEDLVSIAPAATFTYRLPRTLELCFAGCLLLRTSASRLEHPGGGCYQYTS